MFGLSAMEIGVILLVALILFGPKQLPKIARRLGKTLGELRHAGDELKESLTDGLKMEPPPSNKSLQTPANDQSPAPEALLPSCPPVSETAPASEAPHSEETKAKTSAPDAPSSES